LHWQAIAKKWDCDLSQGAARFCKLLQSSLNRKRSQVSLGTQQRRILVELYAGALPQTYRCHLAAFRNGTDGVISLACKNASSQYSAGGFANYFFVG
jgi:hypothetical protein